MTDNTRDFQRYFEVMQRFCTPEELEILRQTYRTPKSVTDRYAKIEALLESEERREWRWQFLRMVALAFASVVGVLATLKAVLPPGWLPW
jgi:hypothetical protein